MNGVVELGDNGVAEHLLVVLVVLVVLSFGRGDNKKKAVSSVRVDTSVPSVSGAP
jgi:hypothetical protein